MKRRRNRRKRRQTVRAAELGNGVDEALMKLDSPAKTRLGISGEDETRVAHGRIHT